MIEKDACMDCIDLWRYSSDNVDWIKSMFCNETNIFAPMKESEEGSHFLYVNNEMTLYWYNEVALYLHEVCYVACRV